jgi:8-oxo-dGTP pyrophosphatase MutT (NUDIX family)
MNEGGTTRFSSSFFKDGVFCCLEIRGCMREFFLNNVYWLAIQLRTLSRRITMPTSIGVRALVLRGDEILLVRHRAGRTPWSLPGGGISRGETLVQAALREICEEGGCRAEVHHLHGMFHQLDVFSDYIAVFVCVTNDEAQAPIGDLEIAEARFFPLQALPKGLDPGSQRRIVEYQRDVRGAYGSW